MATQLLNIITYPVLIPGFPTQIAHSLNIDGRGVIPDLLIPSRGDLTLSADATNVTADTTANSAITSVRVLCVHWHTSLRDFGPINPPPGNALEGNLTPQPFVGAYGSEGPISQMTVTSSGALSPASGASTDATFDTVSFSRGTGFTNTGGGIRANYTGRALFIWQGTWTGNSNGNVRDGRLRELSPTPGDQVVGQQSAPPLGNFAVGLSGSAVLNLAANDIIGARFLQDSGNPLTVVPILQAIQIAD